MITIYESIGKMRVVGGDRYGSFNFNTIYQPVRSVYTGSANSDWNWNLCALRFSAKHNGICSHCNWIRNCSNCLWSFPYGELDSHLQLLEVGSDYRGQRDRLRTDTGRKQLGECQVNTGPSDNCRVSNVGSELCAERLTGIRQELARQRSLGDYVYPWSNCSRSSGGTERTGWFDYKRDNSANCGGPSNTGVCLPAYPLANGSCKDYYANGTGDCDPGSVRLGS